MGDKSTICHLSFASRGSALRFQSGGMGAVFLRGANAVGPYFWTNSNRLGDGRGDGAGGGQTGELIALSKKRKTSVPQNTKNEF